MDKQLSFLTMPATQQTTHHVSNQKKTSFSNRITVHIDGAARGNPGDAGAGIFLTYEPFPSLHKGIFLGKKTNNQAEYLALALALFYAQQLCHEHELDMPHLSIYSDSELLIKQMRGEYKIKNPELQTIKKCIDLFLPRFDCKFNHVIREKNKEADRLANVGIDKKQKPPAAFLKILSTHGLSIL